MQKITQNKALVVTASAIGIGLLGYCAYNFIKRRKIASLTVIKVDSTPLDAVKDVRLIENLFLLAQQAFDNIMKEGKANNQVAMTLYSLFKQQKDGDADEFERNKQTTKPERYAVWLQ